MSSPNPPEKSPDDASKPESLDTLMKRFEQLLEGDPDQISPEDIQRTLGSAKLGDVMAQFREQASELLANLPVDDGELEDDDFEDDELDEDDDFDDEDLDERFFSRPVAPMGSFNEFPGSEELWRHAFELPSDERLHVTIEITSPPVTRVEKLYYHTCHYQLVFDPFDTKVTYRDVQSPRQDYLSNSGWPEMLKSPREMWPELTPLWDTISVYQFNLRQALRSNQYQRHAREDLLSFAEQTLRAALDK